MPTSRNQALSFLLSCFLSAPLLSQNLVPNGSFEEGVTCPTGTANLESECLHWYFSLVPDDFWQPTPDWYHTCAESDFFSPPNVVFGFKEPFDGDGYAGIATYDVIQFDSEYKEVIGVELIEQLETGQNYLVEFWVASLLPGGSLELMVTNNIGFNFSTHRNYHTDFFPINRSHFSVDTIIGFADDWTHVSAEFEADSAYSFLHIGNFYDDDSTLISSEITAPDGAYYVIDAVSVTPVLTSTLRKDDEQMIRIFPNPTINELFIENQHSSDRLDRIEIYSQCGKKLYEKRRLNSSKFKFNTGFLESGTYILLIETNKTVYYEKFLKM